MSTTPAEISRVRRAAEKNDKARAELEAAMRAASDAGYSLRQIAPAAGMSVEWTRQIILRPA